MKNCFDFFNKIYCINLEERTDRWEECLNNFNQYGIENVTKINAIKPTGNLPPKRIGQVGCSLSFAYCIDKAINEKLDNVLILEDDFEFHLEKEDLHKKINSALKELPEDWDSLHFGGTVGNFFGIDPLEKYSENLLKLKSAFAAHCICYSNKGLKKILNHFNNNPEWHKDLIQNYECFDVFLAKLFLPNSNSFISSDLLCYQRITKSDIEQTTYDYSKWMNHNFNYYKNIL